MTVLAGAVSPPVAWRTLLGAWQTGWPSLLSLVATVVVAGWYLRAAKRLRRRGRRWSRWRSASFVSATVLVVVAVQSGLASYDDSVFVLHVVQHLLLMTFAPILYALGAPVTLALQSSSRRHQTLLLRLLHHPVVETVTHPWVVVVLSYGTMVGYFLTPLYRLSLEHPVAHDLTHLHFLVSGVLFWWVVVGLDPARRRLSFPYKLAALGAGIPVSAIVGVTLTGARVSIAPAFHTLADTRAGGSVLWVVGELTTLVAMGIVVGQWMRYEERAAARADRRLDAALAAEDAPGPDPAVAAGDGAAPTAAVHPPT